MPQPPASLPLSFGRIVTVCLPCLATKAILHELLRFLVFTIVRGQPNAEHSLFSKECFTKNLHALKRASCKLTRSARGPVPCPETHEARRHIGPGPEGPARQPGNSQRYWINQIIPNNSKHGPSFQGCRHWWGRFGALLRGSARRAVRPGGSSLIR